jgi:FMN-dependent NADH-azoreductase
VVKAWQAAEPGVVTYRDLAADAISHFSSTTLGAGHRR